MRSDRVVANSIMKARQAGISVRKVLAGVKADDAEGKMLKMIIIDAYKTSHYSTKKYQEQAVIEFEDKWFLSCYNHGK